MTSWKALIGGGLIAAFTMACDDYKPYVYKDEHNLKIKYLDYEDPNEDRFVLSEGFNDWKWEGIAIAYQGQMNKDSVDLAVKRYLEEGDVPSPSDLN
ncbi:MAG: hypothetical protein RIC35_02550 [Marinoscillum sp.]